MGVCENERNKEIYIEGERQRDGLRETKQKKKETGMKRKPEMREMKRETEMRETERAERREGEGGGTHSHGEEQSMAVSSFGTKHQRRGVEENPLEA